MDDYNMWSYWRDKYGITVALNDYYPETLKNDSRLQMAVFQIESAEAMINAIMDAKEEEAIDY